MSTDEETVKDPLGRVSRVAATETPSPGPATPYEDRGELGKGGMGEVRACEDTRLGRTVAMKTLRVEHADHPDMLARFMREVRVQGSLEHPAIVPVYDVGLRDKTPYFTMKRVRGVTLRDVIRDLNGDEPATTQRYSLRKLLAALSQVCAAVHYAHLKGVLHRDLKPANLMFGDFGEVYVLDWGIARTDAGIDSTEGPASSPGLTATGAVTGTMGYMSPEQLRGETIDARADVYSLGAILFAILTHEPLHDQKTEEACRSSTLRGVDVAQRIATLGVEVAPELVAMCSRATELERDKRYSTAGELHDALERFLDGDRDLAVRKKLALTHLALAREAFPPGDDEAKRARVMREASRALALDPELDDAAALLARLMLEPPTTLPAGVEDALKSDMEGRIRDTARTIGPSLAAALMLVPGLVAARSVPYTVVSLAVFAMLVVMARTALRNPRAARMGPWLGAWSVIVVIVGLLFSPPFIGLSVAAVNASVMTTTWTTGFRRSLVIYIVSVAAVMVPLALELVGVLPSTFEVVGRGMLFHAPGFVSGKSLMYTYGIVYIVVVIAVAVMIAHAVRAGEDRLRRALQMNAWHLAQLVRGPQSRARTDAA